MFCPLLALVILTQWSCLRVEVIWLNSQRVQDMDWYICQCSKQIGIWILLDQDYPALALVMLCSSVVHARIWQHVLPVSTYIYSTPDPKSWQSTFFLHTLWNAKLNYLLLGTTALDFDWTASWRLGVICSVWQPWRSLQHACSVGSTVEALAVFGWGRFWSFLYLGFIPADCHSPPLP